MTDLCEQVCPADDGQTALLIAQNAQVRGRCGAVPLEAVKTGLEGARTMVDQMLKIIFDLINIVLDVMQLLSDMTAAARSLVIQDMLFWFQVS